MKTIKGYRFVTNELKSEHGNTKWEIGKWLKCKGELSLCKNGFHASQKPIDSLGYIFGTRWFECEAQGEILKDSDKFCASEMRLITEIPNRVIQQFAIDCAYRVLHIFEKECPNDKRPRQALEAATTYLKFPTQQNLDKLAAVQAAAWAARIAAWPAQAARNAAQDAAQAARIAAQAAQDAAQAAQAAAWAAQAAERKWQTRHLLNLIKKEVK